jgi:hypothetical protein
MIGGEIAPNDVDVPRAASLEVCPTTSSMATISRKTYPGIYLQKQCSMPSWRGWMRLMRCADIRLHVRLLYHPPRMISTIGHADYLDLIMPSIDGPNYANLKIPVVPRHPRTNKRFFELEPTSFLSALYVPISKHFAKVFKPTDPISPYYDETVDGLFVLHLRRGNFDRIVGILLNTLPGTTGTTVLTSFRNAQHPFWQVTGRGKCRSVPKALFPQRGTDCESREGREKEARRTMQHLHHDEWKGQSVGRAQGGIVGGVSTSRAGVCREWSGCPRSPFMARRD